MQFSPLAPPQRTHITRTTQRKTHQSVFLLAKNHKPLACRSKQAACASFAEDWLSEVTVWISYEFSALRMLDIQSHEPCAHLSGQVSPGASATVHCRRGASGRFVIVGIQRARNPLSLCEVEVYGTPGDRQTTSCPFFKTHVKIHVIVGELTCLTPV